jgi:hypothetical protein
MTFLAGTASRNSPVFRDRHVGSLEKQTGFMNSDEPGFVELRIPSDFQAAS